MDKGFFKLLLISGFVLATEEDVPLVQYAEQYFDAACRLKCTTNHSIDIVPIRLDLISNNSDWRDIKDDCKCSQRSENM